MPNLQFTDLPCPAAFMREPFSKIGHPRIRCQKKFGRRWWLNYSLIEVTSAGLEARLDEWQAALTSASSPLVIKDLEITIIDSEGGENCQKELSSILTKSMRNFASLTDEILRHSSLKMDVIPIYLSWTASLPAEIDLGVEDFHNYDLADAEDQITDAFWEFASEFETWAAGVSDMHITYEWQR